MPGIEWVTFKTMPNALAAMANVITTKNANTDRYTGVRLRCLVVMPHNLGQRLTVGERASITALPTDFAAPSACL